MRLLRGERVRGRIAMKEIRKCDVADPRSDIAQK
jgi:hypothetical protein